MIIVIVVDGCSATAHGRPILATRAWITFVADPVGVSPAPVSTAAATRQHRPKVGVGRQQHINMSWTCVDDARGQ